MQYTVNKLAKAARISVRTLHYYDEIDLLTPSTLGENKYRYYGEDEFLRLQQIMFFRELEFPLQKIKEILDSPKFDYIEALENHRSILNNQKDRVSKLIKTIDMTINNLKKGESMTTNNLYSGFTKTQMEEYQKEAQERWGNTIAFKQSTERVKKMGKAGLDKVIKEGRIIEQELVSVMQLKIESEEVQKVDAKHRSHINNFYDVNDEIYQGLAQMYVSDPRFAKHYNDIARGLAEFLSKAMIQSLNVKKHH